MKPYLLLSFIIFTFCNQFSLVAQYEVDYSKNFDTIKLEWYAYSDSLYQINLQNGDTTYKGTGMKDLSRWTSYWQQYMPPSGNFVEAFHNRAKLLEDQKLEHFKLTNFGGSQSSALSAGAVNWEEIGPVNYSSIKKNMSSGNWQNPHLQNTDGSSSFQAHTAKIDKIYQHPSNSNVLFACAGGYENGGGGLFKSTDAGETWQILGTDKIPNPIVNTFAIKPLGVQPSPELEILFIGLGTGAVYRSIDGGQNWLEAGYNGVLNYPFVNTSLNIAQSLPYSYDFINSPNDFMGQTECIKMTRKGNNESLFSRAIVARTGGLFYSDNFNASLVGNHANNTLTSNIVWNKFDVSNLTSQINIQNGYMDEIHFTDFESFEKNGQFYYLAHFYILEYNNLNALNRFWRIRQFVLTSSDYGNTWSFLGGLTGTNTIQGMETAPGMIQAANIECLSSNPNYIYAASIVNNPNPVGSSYNLRRYDLVNSSWDDLSEIGTFPSNFPTQAHGFAINPLNENEYWFYTNAFKHYLNGTLAHSGSSYGTYFHADARCLLVQENGDMFLGTDGGIYKSTVSNGGVNWSAKSEGLNAAQASLMAVSQQPPFYIYSGFWHSGLQVYSPDVQEWHWASMGDGAGGNPLFLNNERFFAVNQYFNLAKFSQFNSLSPLSTANNTGYYASNFGPVSSSENISGRVYGINRNRSNLGAQNPNFNANSSDEIHYSNDDYSSIQGFFTGFSPGQTSYPKDPEELLFPHTESESYTIPNEPDLLIVKVVNYDEKSLYLYSGMAAPTPSPVLEKVIDLSLVHSETNGIHFEFDHRRNKVCWIVLRGRPLWSSDESHRIIEFNYETETYEDITFELDNVTTSGSPSFPTYVGINSIKMDRETGVLYIATTNGVFYLDRDNEIWKRYSKNVPFFNTSLGIIHCTGEIYASTNYRGIWKTDLIRTAETPALEWKITQNETWTERMNLFCTLMIEPGATLTVQDELVVYGNQKIIVKPGGRLIIDGGTITTECGEFWQGIEVWGNSNLSQNTTNQGYLHTKNNAKIENAKEAIRVWKTDDWASTGGIVKCYNTTFKNNWRTSEYIYYHYFNTSGNEVLNQGIFQDCSFEWDDDYIGGNYINTAVTLFHVNGVRFIGCDFVDSRTGSVTRTTGIGSLDAGYKIYGRDLNPGTFTNPNIDHEYDETDFDISHFQNLKIGVQAMSSTAAYPIIVDHCAFINDEVGIQLDAVDNATVTRNKFLLDEGQPGGLNGMFQLVTRNSTGYKIEGNKFFRSNSGNTTVGTALFDSGMNDNRVYRNEFDGLTVGNYAYGYNSNDLSTINSSRGLYWKCNEHLSNYKDLLDYVPSYSSTDDGEGVKELQGNISEAAGNTFSASITSANPATDAHIDHGDQDLMGYFYYINDNSQKPTEIFGNVASTAINFDRNCTSGFNPITIGHVHKRMLKSEKYYLLRGELDDIETSITDQERDLEDLLENGDRAALYTLVSNVNLSNRQQVKADLLSESPYVSQGVLERLGTVDPSIFPHDWLEEIIIENAEVALERSFIDFLENKTYPLPDINLVNVKASRYDKVTDRGEKQMVLNKLYEEREVLYNLFLADEYSDTTIVNYDSLLVYLHSRNHPEEQAELIELHLSRLDATNALAALDAIDNYGGVYPLTRTAQDMHDFSLFKRYMLAITDSTGLVDSLSQQEISELTYMAENFQGKAAREARNLLCFFVGQCDDVRLTYNKEGDEEGKSGQFTSEQQDPTLALGVYPNPNKGTFALVIPENCTFDKIRVTDVQGKMIAFEQYPVNKSTVDIELLRPHANAIYLINVNCKDGSVYGNRILVSQ